MQIGEVSGHDANLIYCICGRAVCHLVFLSVVRNVAEVVSHVRGKLWEAPSSFVVKGDITHNSTRTTMFFYQMSLPHTAVGGSCDRKHLQMTNDWISLKAHNSTNLQMNIKNRELNVRCLCPVSNALLMLMSLNSSKATRLPHIV